MTKIEVFAIGFVIAWALRPWWDDLVDRFLKKRRA